MADYPFSRFEADVLRAERLREDGAYRDALGLYRDILHDRLTHLNETSSGGPRWQAADLVVIEQTADLSVLCGHTQAADDLLDAAVTLSAEAGNHYAAAYTLLKRVHLAVEGGRLRRAYGLLGELRENTGELTELDLSEEGLERWEPTCRWPGTSAADRRVLFSRLYLAMARILAGLGQYADTLAAYARGLAHAGADAPALARQAAPHLRLGRAAALIEAGALDDAEAALGELADTAGTAGTADTADTAAEPPGFAVRRLELSGKLDLMRGRFGRALRAFESVQAVCQRYGFERAWLAATLNLSHVFVYLNQTYKAERLLGEVASAAALLGETAFVERARCFLDLAQARAQSLADAVPVAPSVFESWGADSPRAAVTSSSDAGPALELLDTAEESDYLAWFEDRSLGFYWRLDRLELAAAAAAHDELRQTFSSTDSSVVRLRLEVTAGILDYYRGEFESAAARLGDACEGLAELGLRPELWQARRFLGWCLARLGRADAEQRALAEQTGALMAELAASLEGPEQALYLLNKWTAEEEAFAFEINELASLREAAEAASPFARPLRRRQLNRRVKDLLHRVDRYKASHTVRDAGDAETRQGAAGGLLWRLLSGRGRATLSFLVLPDRLFVARRVGSKFDFGVSPVTRLELRNLVRRWHEAARDSLVAPSGQTPGGVGRMQQRGLGAAPRPPGSDGRAPVLPRMTDEVASFDPSSPAARPSPKIGDGWDKVSERLAAALLLRELLSGLPASTSSLTITPDDCLHGLPFAAVRHDGRYLVERFAIALAFESDAPPPDRGARAASALAVAVSEGFGAQYPSLPGTVKELELVSDCFSRKGVEVRRLADAAGSDEKPTREAVLAHLRGAEIFHIACHGQFEPDALDRTGLLLPGGTAGAGAADLLSLRELAALDLAGLQHASLTACWSADNYILPGRWVISLPEVMWRAGARSVLGSLWPAEDTIAASLVEKFYGYLDEHPRDEALRRAQLDCLRGDLLPATSVAGLAPSHPVFWAGYRIYGDPGRLRLSGGRK